MPSYHYSSRHTTTTTVICVLALTVPAIIEQPKPQHGRFVEQMAALPHTLSEQPHTPEPEPPIKLLPPSTMATATAPGTGA